LRVIREAAVTEPALAGLWDRIETEFRAVLGGFAGRLAALGALAPGVDVGFATDLLWTLNHPDTWYLLVQGCGWSEDAYEQLVGDTLIAQLLGLSPAPAGRRRGCASNSKGGDRHGRHRVPGLPARRPRPRVGRSPGREAGPPVGRGRG